MTIPVESFVRRRGGVVVLALALVACDVQEILDVPDPDVATPISIENKTALPAVLAGAQADLMVAYNGNVSTNLVTGTGLITDELIHAETFPTRIEFDQRNIQASSNGDLETVFRNLHRARISASRAAEAYVKFDTTQHRGWAESLSIEGFTYVMFGENWCNGMPFSRLDASNNPVFGDGISNDSMFALAIARFDSALKVIGAVPPTASDTTQTYIARVGKARALLNRGQFAAAAAVTSAAPTVPQTFTYSINHSDNTTRQQNGTFTLIYDGRRFGVGNSEGTVGLPFRTDGDTAGTVLDPRVRNGRGAGTAAFGFDGATQLFQEKKYPLRTTAIVVASGVEARLIEAEADLQAGGVAWVTTLNTLRTSNNPPMAGTLVPGATTAASQDLFFKERAYFLWLTAHRLGDMRRLIRQYGRLANSVFPNGAYAKGGIYGGDINFPISFDEKNNPKFVECTDRNP